MKPILILMPTGARRAAWVRTAIKTKALRIILAGRLGSAPAVATLLTANNRNVFIIFPPDCVAGSPVMYTSRVGINVYPSSRNFKYFSVLAGLADAPQGGEVWLIRRALRETRPHPDSRRAASLTTASKTKALRIIF